MHKILFFYSCIYNPIIILLIIIILVLVLLYIYNKYFQSTKSIYNTKISYANINDPYIMPKHLKNFITSEQCNIIIQLSQNRLVDSEILSGTNKNIRNSQQSWISKNDPITYPIFKKASNMFNIPFENGEDLQVVRYLPGQFFNEHHDSCCDDNDKCMNFIKRGGQRVLTILIYLNNDFEGGFTYFKNLELKFKINKGDALVFYPLATGTNQCHPYALHAGMPVTHGEKWIANLWFREEKFT